MSPRYRITLANASHVASLPAIERAAAALLDGHAPAGALTDTTSIEELSAAQREQRLWVAVDGETPVGFALVAMLRPNSAYLQEMDVHPEQMRQGVGAALLEAVLSWVQSTRRMPLMLTTFRDVPFNAPFYARHGFTVVDPAGWPAEVRTIVDAEHARGLDRAQRVVMQYVQATP